MPILWPLKVPSDKSHFLESPFISKETLNIIKKFGRIFQCKLLTAGHLLHLTSCPAAGHLDTAIKQQQNTFVCTLFAELRSQGTTDSF